MTTDARPTVPAAPTELQLEVTGACNLACRMCLVRYRPRLGRTEGRMDARAAVRLLDDLPGLRRLTLQGLGEPLLVPDLEELVAVASARGIVVGFNTNGTLLSARRAAALADAGLGWLHVSVDGARPETYAWVRDGADLRTVAANVKGAVRVFARRPDPPRLSLVTVAMRRNIAEVPDVVRLAAGWGVGRLWVQHLSHDFADAPGSRPYARIRGFVREQAIPDGDPAARAAYARARRRAARLGVDLRLPAVDAAPPAPRAPGEPGCDWPWRSAYVTHTGTVQPCCMVMGADRASLGEVSSGFAQVWGGAEYRGFRERLLGDDPPEVCRGCAAYRRRF
jgi:radical SAM protein with 4Fe4S-binding SPASM domain